MIDELAHMSQIFNWTFLIEIYPLSVVVISL